MILVAGTEEAGDRAREALGLIAPRNAFPRAESLFHLRHVLLKRGRRSEGRGEIERAAWVGENKRLLRRHRESFDRRLKGDVIRCGLGREPLSEIALLQSRPRGQFIRGERTAFAQRLVKPEAF